MHTITIENRPTEGRQLVSVTDLGNLRFQQVPHTNHLYSGVWYWNAGAVFGSEWTVLYEFSDGTTGLSRPEDIPAALEALGKRVSTTPPTLTSVAPGEPTPAHIADINTISDVLGQEAVSRGWCGDYERVLAVINRRLTVPMTDRHNRCIITRL